MQDVSLLTINSPPVHAWTAEIPTWLSAEPSTLIFISIIFIFVSFATPIFASWVWDSPTKVFDQSIVSRGSISNSGCNTISSGPSGNTISVFCFPPISKNAKTKTTINAAPNNIHWTCFGVVFRRFEIC